MGKGKLLFYPLFQLLLLLSFFSIFIQETMFFKNSLCLPLQFVVVVLLLQLQLEPLQSPVLVHQFMPQPGNLRLRLTADLVQGGLQGIDPGGKVEL